MSTYAIFGGAVNAEGAAKFMQHLFRTGYASGLAVSQRGAGANMSVDISIGGGLHVTSSGVAYFGYDDAVVNASVTSASPSNPRKDIVVSYIDLSMITTSSTNNAGALKFMVVAGTPAGSPTDPSDPTIQSAVGAGNPWNKLARVDVAASASSIVNANITDLRNPMAFAVPYLFGGSSNTKGHLVPNVADDTVALLAATQTLTNKTLTSPTINGPVSGQWWQEIARTTLSASGDTITVSSIPPRRYLKVLMHGIAAGGTLDTFVRFNNDTAANYSRIVSVQLGAGTSDASQSSFSMESGATDSGQLNSIVFDIFNDANKEKNVYSFNISQDAVGAATPPTTVEFYGKWANTSVQLSRIDWVNGAGTGDFAVGSEVVVLGHD